jgi:hypothetical protein
MFGVSAKTSTGEPDDALGQRAHALDELTELAAEGERIAAEREHIAEEREQVVAGPAGSFYGRGRHPYTDGAGA